MTTYLDPNIRHDMVLLIDATDSNPNGDPDDDGRPRVDYITGQGLVSGHAIKRKIRDRVAALTENEDRPGCDIFVRRGTFLNETLKSVAGNAKGAAASDAIAAAFFDVRMFGGVISTAGDTGPQAKSLRGPVQISWARSLHPVGVLDHALTRVARNERDEKHPGKDDHGQMGSVSVIRYGLYQATVTYNPQMARDAAENKTRVSADDLDLFYRAVTSMFVNDEAAGRTGMAVRGLHVFTHDSPLGSAPAHRLRELVTVTLRDGITDPTGFADYTVTIDPPGNSQITYADLTDYAWSRAVA